MVKRTLCVLVMLSGLMAPRLAMAGCTTRLADCYGRAAGVDSFWYRWAAGLDCELDYTECVRIKVIGG